MNDPVAAFRAAHAAGRPLSLSTSGTAGRPRQVRRSTDSWVDSFAAVSRLTGIGADSRVWVPGPLNATMNLFALVHADWAGARISEELAGATHAHLTPSRLAHLLADRSASVAGVHLILAGDRLEPSLHRAATELGARVSHYYGAAELSFVAWGPHAEALSPFPGVEIEIRDPSGRPVPAGRSGQIWVRSPYTAECGLAQPRVGTSASWCTVGDRGVLEPDGRLVVHGRDGAITTSGATVMIAEVEHELRPVAVGDLVVIGTPHPDLGEVVTAVLTEPADLGPVREHARARLAAAARPRRWAHLEALPLTDAGKIDRLEIARQLRTGRARRLT